MAQGGEQKKMKFTYTYRSSDGQRHTAEIKAESRDAAFAKIRTDYFPTSLFAYFDSIRAFLV